MTETQEINYHEYMTIWDGRVGHTEKLVDGKWKLVADPENTKTLWKLNYGTDLILFNAETKDARDKH